MDGEENLYSKYVQPCVNLASSFIEAFEDSGRRRSISLLSPSTEVKNNRRRLTINLNKDENQNSTSDIDIHQERNVQLKADLERLKELYNEYRELTDDVKTIIAANAETDFRDKILDQYNKVYDETTNLQDCLSKSESRIENNIALFKQKVNSSQSRRRQSQIHLDYSYDLPDMDDVEIKNSHDSVKKVIDENRKRIEYLERMLNEENEIFTELDTNVKMLLDY